MKPSRFLLSLSLLALAGCASNDHANRTSAGYYSTVSDPAFYTNPWQDEMYVNIPGIRPTPPVVHPSTLPAPLPGAQPLRVP